MNNIALIFPGQGSQAVGMCSDMVEEFPEINETLEQAGDILGLNLKKLCFEGPDEELVKTENTQPALFTISACLLNILKKNNIKFKLTAGHSLGEYSAYHAAGFISFEQGLKAVRKRGLLMANADKKKTGTMSAIIGLDAEKVIEICKNASKEGIVVPANFNSPNQIVISGEKRAVKQAGILAEDESATVIPLTVSGAFHSPLMKPASRELEKYFNENLDIAGPNGVRVISNVYAKIIEPENIRTSLVEQLTSPVKWIDSVKTMIEMGINTFIEVGPKNILSNLMRKINKDVNRFSTNTIENLKNILETI